MSGALAGRPFLKMHGLRNHFVIVDARDEPYATDAGTVVRICDVQTGIGADQLIVIEASRRDEADAFMRIYNTDGREAEACGNAMRCVAWLLLEEQRAETLSIETLAGVLRCERVGSRQVRCEMGRVTLDDLHLDITSGPLSDPVTVNVGNPHAVFFVADLAALDLGRHAPAIQRHAAFPRQVNVGAAELLDPGHMKLAVYERGAGLTMACGSGACAAAYAARARGLTTARRMRVELPGGGADIEIREDDVALLTGPVAYAFRGTLPDAGA